MTLRLRKPLAAIAAARARVDVASAQTLLRDAEIEEWLDEYSRPLFKAAGLPAEQIDILLIGDPTPNAFASGLLMGIHTGLITAADTPNQVEGVIAHETGHMAGGHTARSDEAMSAAVRPMLLSLVLAAAAAAAGAPQAGIGVLGLGQTIGMANVLRYSRGQEASADQAAVTYLDAVGHSSNGLIEFFDKLKNYQILTGKKVNPYLQSHPLALQRTSALAERAELSNYFDRKDSLEEIERLKLIQAKINGFLQETNVTLRQYPLSDQSDPAHYARAVAYYRGASIDKALVDIDYLIGHYPTNPYFIELRGQMLFEFGRVEESIPSHARSVELAPTKALLRINLGRALIATEDAARYPEAVKELKAALLIEPENSFGWFELARAYGGLGEEALADLATAESRFHAGARGEAALFASRAKARLKKGTPEWRQASDIIATVVVEGGPGVPYSDERDTEKPSPDDEKAPDEGDVPDPQFY
ncbi:MAG: M48 family metalloprotease [Parvularculaceae bacterium]